MHWDPEAGLTPPLLERGLVVVRSTFSDEMNLEESLRVFRAQLENGMGILFIDDSSRNDSVAVGTNAHLRLLPAGR